MYIFNLIDRQNKGHFVDNTRHLWTIPASIANGKFLLWQNDLHFAYRSQYNSVDNVHITKL